MNARFLGLVPLLLGLQVGCSGPPTSVFVTLELAPLTTPPSRIEVHVFDDFKRIADLRSFEAPSFPSSFRVRVLRSGTRKLRVVVRGPQPVLVGGGWQGLVTDGQESKVSITLSGAVSDTDGDGVLDPYDNCPLVPNPEQEDADGEPPGNACGGANGGSDAGWPWLGDGGGVTSNGCAGLVGFVELCEDFETDPLASGGSVNSGGALAMVSTAARRSGSSSLLVHLLEGGGLVDAGGQYSNTLRLGPAPSTMNDVNVYRDVYVRAWFLPAPTLDTQKTARKLMWLRSIFGPDMMLSVELKGLQLVLRNEMNGPAVARPSASTTGAVRLGEWNCLEWHVYQGAPGKNYISLNGATVADLTDEASATDFGQEFGALSVGQLLMGAGTVGTGEDLWVDDIIVDRVPIGCAR